MKRFLSGLSAFLAIVTLAAGCRSENINPVRNFDSGAQVATFSSRAQLTPVKSIPTFSTSSRMATATPQPTEFLGPFILLQDDFSDPTTGWEISENDYGRSGYENGRYLVEARIEKEYFWGVAGINASDIRIEVDASVIATVQSGNDAFGVDCRIQENGDGYGFRISSDGFVSIAKYVDTQGQTLIDWIENSAVYTDGRTNHLTAICQGDHLQFLVNDINVAEVVDDTFSTGDIALSALAFEPGTIRVLFDNIIVQEIGNPYEYAD